MTVFFFACGQDEDLFVGLAFFCFVFFFRRRSQTHLKKRKKRQAAVLGPWRLRRRDCALARACSSFFPLFQPFALPEPFYWPCFFCADTTGHRAFAPTALRSEARKKRRARSDTRKLCTSECCYCRKKNYRNSMRRPPFFLLFLFFLSLQPQRTDNRKTTFDLSVWVTHSPSGTR